MNCVEWKSRMDAYIDAELQPQEMEAFRAHAAACIECSSAAYALLEAKNATRRAGQRYAAPSALRARVMSLSKTDSATSGASGSQSRQSALLAWPRWALAATALLLLVAGVFFAADRYRQPGSLAEFADLHVADLASANPVEVVSSDRHTVKPWFQGRIPFTFDVPDLQGSPFTLTGGRVTYFHQEPGAELLFAYQRHYISVFIFRDTPQLAIRGTSFADHGTSFNLQTFTHNGLRYVLVSDISSDTLQKLTDLFQHPR